VITNAGRQPPKYLYRPITNNGAIAPPMEEPLFWVAMTTSQMITAARTSPMIIVVTPHQAENTLPF
jgi:hypothetical protein